MSYHIGACRMNDKNANVSWSEDGLGMTLHIEWGPGPKQQAEIFFSNSEALALHEATMTAAAAALQQRRGVRGHHGWNFMITREEAGQHG